MLEENSRTGEYIINFNYESGLEIEVELDVESYRFEVIEYHYDFVDERVLDDIAQESCPRAKQEYQERAEQVGKAQSYYSHGNSVGTGSRSNLGSQAESLDGSEIHSD